MPCVNLIEEYKLGDRILRIGMAGSDIKVLQDILIRLEYDCSIWDAVGDFGNATQLAVKKFQRAHGCQVDGVVGPETLTAMMEAEQKHLADLAHMVQKHNSLVRHMPVFTRRNGNETEQQGI